MILEVLTTVLKPHEVHEEPSLLRAAGGRAKLTQSHLSPRTPALPDAGP